MTNDDILRQNSPISDKANRHHHEIEYSTNSS